MRLRGRRAFLGCLCCGGAALAARRETAAAEAGLEWPTALELGMPGMARIGPREWVSEIAQGVWLHCTLKGLDDGTLYPVNGLMAERPGGAVMIDTANNAGQARRLAEWWRGRGGEIRLAVATHFHSDRTGGIDGLRALGVKTLGHGLTRRLALRHGIPAPEAAPFAGGVWRIDDAVEVFAPGAGHTRDNVVVWLADQKILFGGCMLKSVSAPDLGYLADAAVGEWPRSVRRVRERYAEARMAVPGHGTASGDPIGATLRLLAEA